MIPQRNSEGSPDPIVGLDGGISCIPADFYPSSMPRVSVLGDLLALSNFTVSQCGPWLKRSCACLVYEE